MTEPTKIDDVLRNFGMTRELLTKKNPAYQDDFVKLDKYYERYSASPSDSVLNATNKITFIFLDKLQKENPEMFEVAEEEDAAVEIKVDDKFTKHKEDLLFYIEERNQDAMEDLFKEVGEKNAKHLLTFDNFKPYNKAITEKNTLIIYYLMEQGKKYGIFKEVILGRDGELLNKLIATKNVEILNEAFQAIKGDERAAEMFKKYMVAQQMVELGDIELATLAEEIQGEEAEAPASTPETSIPEKKPKKKASAVVTEQAPLKDLVEKINSGVLALDIPLVVRLEKKFAIRILDTAEEIANGSSDYYRFIVPTAVSRYFDAKILFTDSDYTIYEAKKTDFERQFGTSVYELGICWYNLINLISVEDVLCLLYLANISTSLMVDRNNVKLRTEYLDKLRFVITNPESNKIDGKFFTVKEANLMSLKRSGFLDENYCPTKLLYCAIVLHSFPFPAYTHPFEFIKINELNSMFQFKTLKGEFGNESFFTDGDVLFHNFSDLGVTNYSTALTDVSRTTILNLKSNGRADITKQSAVINHFIPFIYTVPKSGVVIPTFSIKMLDTEGRRINWGVYELQNNDKKIFVNSYALSNIIMNTSEGFYSIMTYDGVLSDTIFASPKEGVIVKKDNSYVAVRGINANQFLSDNFGKNWEKYYDEMYSKQHLSKEVLNKLDPDMVKAIFESENVLIGSTVTGLEYKLEKKYEPTFQKEAVKPPPQVRKIIVPVAKKDDRIYITPTYAREKLDRVLIPVFDKIQSLRGEQRDEAILDEMYAKGIDRVFPKDLVYMGFGLKEWITDKPERINFKNKYRLVIPVFLSFKPTYYLEKI
jgi:hypothetical protein